MMNKIFQRNMKPNNNNYQGKEFEADNWLLSEFIVKKVIPVVGFHPFPINELLLMAASVAYTKPTHIFEWGTNVGKSARVFYEVCKFLQLDTAIHSVDLPDNEHHVEHPHKHRGKYVKGKNNQVADGLSGYIEVHSNEIQLMENDISSTRATIFTVPMKIARVTSEYFIHLLTIIKLR